MNDLYLLEIGHNPSDLVQIMGSLESVKNVFWNYKVSSQNIENSVYYRCKTVLHGFYISLTSNDPVTSALIEVPKNVNYIKDRIKTI